MSPLFSIPSTLPSHLVTEMLIGLWAVMEAMSLEILGDEILGRLGGLASFYIGIQQNLSSGRTQSCNDRRSDWKKYCSPRSTRDGLKPALV